MVRVADFRRIALLLAMAAAVAGISRPQARPDLPTFFRGTVGLTADQISAIQSGRSVVKVMSSPTPEEIFLFGAVYIHATPESYLKFSRDLDQLRKSPEYLATVKFRNPPKLSDLDSFGFDADEIQDLKKCKPGNCEFQIPADSMAALQQSINWSAPNVTEQVNQLVRKSVLDHLLAYQRRGDPILGTYNDKPIPTDVSKDFEYLLSFSKTLTEYLPGFYRYLLDYPKGKPANLDNWFYWSKVKFGLKPTLRIVQVVTFSGGARSEIAYAIAEKQLYSSHYFETALDLTFCVRSEDKTRPGFYLIMAMGSAQAGLTGLKGAIMRKEAVDRSASSLQQGLAAVKDTLEKNQR